MKRTTTTRTIKYPDGREETTVTVVEETQPLPRSPMPWEVGPTKGVPYIMPNTNPMDPFAQWAKRLGDNQGERCAFDGLEPGKAYGLVCHCPRCSFRVKMSASASQALC